MSKQDYHEKNLERSLNATSTKLQDLSSTSFEFGRWYGFNEACEQLSEIFMNHFKNNPGQPVSVADALATIAEIYQENSK